MENVKANYNCSQAVLYVVLRMLAENVTNNMARLAGYKSKYDPEFVTAFLTMITNAQNLPSEQARSLAHETLRDDLIDLAKTCRMNFQMLKGYIEDAFEESKWVMNFDAAGWQYYEAAGNNNWDSVSEMMSMAVNYTNANAEVLQADGYMGDDFIDKITASQSEFNDKLQAFLQAEEQSQTGTQSKLIANNSCYTMAASICRDGQTVATMNDDPSMFSQFSFEALVALVQPAGAASLIVDVTVNGVEKVGAEVMIDNTDKSGVTNENGRAVFTQMPDGPLSYTIVDDGFEEVHGSTTLIAGSTKRVSAELQPILTGEMRAGSVSAETVVGEQ